MLRVLTNRNYNTRDYNPTYLHEKRASMIILVAETNATTWNVRWTVHCEDTDALYTKIAATTKVQPKSSTHTLEKYTTSRKSASLTPEQLVDI